MISQYMYNVGKYIIYLYEMTCVAASGNTFGFTTDVRILCLSSNNTAFNNDHIIPKSP